MRGFFHRQSKFQPVDPDENGNDQSIPDDLWVKCPGCNELLYSKELNDNLRVCPKCEHHFRLRARERIAMLTDVGSFQEWSSRILPQNPLGFADGSGTYEGRLERTQRKSGELEAVIAGEATVEGKPLALVVCDFDFLGASMGSVFGEKLVRATEAAIERGIPLMTINASGGARMHEGLFSLMQMAKTVAALNRLGAAGLPHLSVLTDPCYGGVTASYATVADVVMAEPKAMVGFAGPRVIEQTTKQKLPEGFQTAEFLLEHGMVDLIVSRDQLRVMTASLLTHYENARVVAAEASAAVNAEAHGEDIVVSFHSMAPERAPDSAQTGEAL
ncbi:MAG: acetyl-CoA carboxylase carboxyltransferase subunit beta [Thermomicrobiales bacterium]|nr:acetyl-CoA carboxylase carboxyltransferase subunit beta [Thermomicrobiales bacterium]